MKVIILAKHSAWGAADNFYRAFSSCGFDTTLLCLKKDKTGRTEGENIVTFLSQDNFNKWYDIIMSKNTFLFICSPMAIVSVCKYIGKRAENIFRKDKKSIFITGTDYLNRSKYWNSKLDSYNFSVRFSEPEMVNLNPKKNIPLLHPMEYNLSVNKGENVIVSHAPGMVERDKKKGTSIIEKGIKEARKVVSFEYDHIVGVSLSECLKRKARSHIFIDQINKNVGGIGKNGLEALSLNCVTMCSINNFSSGKRYASHPIINVQSSEDVTNNIVYLLKNREVLNKEIQKVSEWKSIIGYKSTVEFISECIRGL